MAILNDFGTFLEHFWDHLGPFCALLGASWPILGSFGSLFGPSWSYLGPFEAILGHLGTILGKRAFKRAPAGCNCGWPPNFRPILGSILGPKICLFFAFSGVIFWTLFWSLFGPLLDPFWGPFWDQIGPRRGQDEPKRPIKSFKDPKSCISKNLKKTI